MPQWTRTMQLLAVAVCVCQCQNRRNVASLHHVESSRSSAKRTPAASTSSVSRPTAPIAPAPTPPTPPRTAAAFASSPASAPSPPATAPPTRVLSVLAYTEEVTAGEVELWSVKDIAKRRWRRHLLPPLTFDGLSVANHLARGHRFHGLFCAFSRVELDPGRVFPLIMTVTHVADVNLAKHLQLHLQGPPRCAHLHAIHDVDRTARHGVSSCGDTPEALWWCASTA